MEFELAREENIFSSDDYNFRTHAKEHIQFQ